METYIKFNKSATAPQVYDWNSINWKRIYKYVKKLRQRIFHAEQLKQTRRVKKLQRLMIRSKAKLLLLIKRVTQINKGKRTAGVDKMVITNDKERIELYNIIKNYNIKSIKVKPAKRAYIPKKNEKLRPLGIPIIKDRIYQNIVKNALEPQWEYRFESISYGFRPKRSAQDEEEMSKRKSMGIQHSMCVQPAFLIGTYDEDGNVNFAPITWVSVTCDTDHFMLVISMFGSKKTKLNVIKTTIS